MVRSHQMKHMLRRKPMTCVSTARRITEPVDTKQPLCSHVGTLSIHPTVSLSSPPRKNGRYAYTFLSFEPRQAR